MAALRGSGKRQRTSSVQSSNEVNSPSRGSSTPAAAAVSSTRSLSNWGLNGVGPKTPSPQENANVTVTKRCRFLPCSKHSVRNLVDLHEKQDKLGDEAEHWGRMRSSLAKGGSPDGFHLEVNALPCKGGAECLELRYMTMARLDGKDGHLRHMPSNWYLMLDPRSCEVTQDKDGFGVYWCEDRRCRNYWQYARSRWRPFLRNDDYIRACPE
jgi:hypothetical protein